MEDIVKPIFDNLFHFIQIAKQKKFVCEYVYDAMRSNKPYGVCFGYKSNGYEIGCVKGEYFNTPEEALRFAKKYDLKPTE